MNEFEREHAIRTIVTRIAHTIDARQWSELRRLYADEVETDYTSLFGGDVQHQKGDDLIEAWRRMLTPLTATQHLVGPIEVRVRGERAAADCHVRGYHILDGQQGSAEWMVAGHWAIELVENAGMWKITKMTLQTFYQTGEKDLLQRAPPG